MLYGLIVRSHSKERNYRRGEREGQIGLARMPVGLVIPAEFAKNRIFMRKKSEKR